MVNYRIPVRNNTTGMIWYLTDTQSINQLLMSCQCTKIIPCKGRGKRRCFPPHTARYGILGVRGVLPTIETCFNCFGTRSSDANERIKTTEKLRCNFKVYTPNFLETAPPPPLAGEWGEVTKIINGASA